MDPISKVLKKKGKEEKQSCKDVSEKTLWKRYFKKWRKPSLGWLASVFSPITGYILIAGYKSSLFRSFLSFSEKLPQFHKKLARFLVTGPGHPSYSLE
jgi:hypothetical protein